MWSGWHDIGISVRTIGLSGTAIVLTLAILNFGLRFLRWSRYLSAMGHDLPWWPSLKIYIAGFALTTTPGKAGEILRGVLLKGRGVPYSRSLAALFSERLSDLVAIILLTIVGASLSGVAHIPVALSVAILASGFLAISNQKLLNRAHQATKDSSRRSIRLVHHLFAILLESRRCHTPTLLLVGTALSIGAWMAQAVALYLIVGWLGLDMPLSFAAFVFAVSLLAGAASFMPGGLGGVEASMMGLLMWKGASPAQALAATVLFRLATLWFAVALGAAALALEAKSIHLPREPA